MRFLLVLLLNSQDIDEIVREIQRQAAARYPQLRIVLTSRYGYVNLERMVKRSDNILLLQLSELTPDQQTTWLDQYRSFHPESHLDAAKLSAYNTEAKFKSLRELITQPILLHMVATLEEGLSDAVNRAAICHQLNSFSPLL